MEKKVDRYGLTWSNAPAEEEIGSKYRLIRTPPKGGLAAIILSHEIAGTHTHWSGNQTRPCLGDKCECQEKDIRKDWHAYFFVMGKKSREVCLFETRPAAALRLSQEFSKLRTLRGLNVFFSRAGERNTSRVTVLCGDQERDRDLLPKVPSVMDTLHIIWKVGHSRVIESCDPAKQEMSEADLVNDGVRVYRSLPGQTFLNNGRDH